MNSRTLAERLGRDALALQYRHLSRDVVHIAKQRLVDTIGCALGALDAQPCRIARGVSLALRPGGPSTILGTDDATAPDLAAFANGVAVRYLDFNDTYLSKEALHPSDTIPALLATAEAAGRGGKALLAAIVLSYEVLCQLADAASIRDRGWDHTTYGAVATAIGAGYLLRLDAARMAQAISLAAASNVTLRQIRVGQLSMWKGAAFGNAGRNGVFAAYLARAGMTGPAEVFEGPRGFWAQVSGPFDLPAIPRRVGSAQAGRAQYKIESTLLKRYPAEYHAQAAIEAALALRGRVAASAIAAVRVDTYKVAVQIIGGEPEKWRPTTRETADHSLPYLVAVALLDGEVGERQFAPQRINDPAVRALMAKIAVHEDLAHTRRYPGALPVRVAVTPAVGRAIRAEVDIPRGHPARPMSDAEIEEKFTRLAARALPAPRRNRLLRELWRMEHHTSLTPVLNLCRASSRR